MDQNVLASSPYTVTNKKRILLAIIGIYALSSVLLWLFESSETAYGLINILSAVAVTVASIIWVSNDAREYDIEIGFGFRIFLILLLPFALTYYFFKTRGFRGGVKSLLKTTGFFFLAAIVTVVVDVGLSFIPT